MAARKKDNEKSYEQLLDRLDEIVKEMEAPEVPLEKSLALYEEGTGIVRLCTGILDKAEQTVSRLHKTEDGSPEELPFDVPEADK